MKAAIDLAREILRKEEAIRITQSENLKRDYTKSIEDDKNELLFYCKIKGLSIAEVFRQAQE